MQKWPFGDFSGSSTISITLKGGKKGKKKQKKLKCNKKAIKKQFKDRNYKCDAQENTNTCHCSEFKDRIAEESNTASHDHFPITATCASNIKSKEGTEAWHLHCDLNGDGKVDEGEETGYVNLITKENKSFCNIKRTLSRGIVCQSSAKANACLCINEAADLVDNFASYWEKPARKGRSAEVKCAAGSAVEDQWEMAITKHGTQCATPVVFNLKHNGDSSVCHRKLLSELNSQLKNTKC